MTRLNLKPASGGFYNHHYSPSTVVSLDFGELVPTLCVRTVLGDKFPKVQGQGKLHLLPQEFPPYGKLFIKNASFFVPETQLIQYSDAFHRGMKSYKGKLIDRPGFSTYDYLYFLAQSSLSVTISSNLDYAAFNSLNADTYDFYIPIDDGGTLKFQPRKFTTWGKKVFKVMKCLGYDLPSFSYSSGYTYSDVLSSGEYFHNALPLLAYCKVYCDMFLNSSFYNTSPLTALLHAVHDNEDFVDSGVTYYSANTHTFTYSGLYMLIANILLPHSQSMYTEAWNAINSPTGVDPVSEMQVQSPSDLISPSLPKLNALTDVVNSSLNSSVLASIDPNASGLYLPIKYISQLGLNILNSLFKLVTRNHLAGSKAVQRIFAAFGIKPNEYKSYFVHKLGEGSNRIDFYPVMSNSDTESGGQGMSLGSYAGYGQSGVNVDYDYEADDYGFFITLHWLQIEPILMRGTDPTVLAHSFLDDYTPEYDGQAYRAIPYAEIASNKKLVPPKHGERIVYGFTRLYEDYRKIRDVVAGEFLSGLAQNWLFARDFSVIRAQSGFTLKPQSNVVQYYDINGVSNGLTDPFQLKSGNGDRFYLFIDWDISASRPIRDESDSSLLNGSGNIEISQNGAQIN